MNATPEQIDALVKLQELDRTALMSKHQMDDLPERREIVQVRTKRAEVKEKAEKIEKLYREAERALESLNEEDEHQAERQKATQAKIDEAKGDYRSVTSLTRDLEGMAKRRETLEFEMNKADAKLGEVSKVRDQAVRAAGQLEAREAKLMGAYRDKGLALQAKIDEARTERVGVSKALPEPILKAYEETSRRCGGVAVSRLEDNRCSACRSVIESNRLLQVKRDAPISKCPSCGRMMVIDR